MIYGYELIKLFSDEEKDKKNSNNVLRNAAIAGGVAVPASAYLNNLGFHYKTVKKNKKELKDSMDNMKRSRSSLLTAREAVKDAADKINSFNSEMKAKGSRTNIKMRRNASDVNNDFSIRSSVFGSTKDLDARRAENLFDNMNDRRYHLLDKQGNYERSIHNAKFNKKMYKDSIKRLAGSAGKTVGGVALAGGLAAAGTAAYNHFKDKKNKRK